MLAALLSELAAFHNSDPPLALEDWIEVFQQQGPKDVSEDGAKGAGLFEVLGAFEGECPVGFLMFSQVFSLKHAAPAAVLSDLFVSSDKRRMGIGRALMKTLAALCIERGWKRIDWHVERFDFDARTFYDMLCDESFKLDMLSYRIELNEIETLASS